MRLLIVLALGISVGACSAIQGPRVSGITFTDAPLTGKFIWHDLITQDPEAAKRFYGELFGWSFEETTGARGNAHVLARSDDRVVVGLVPIESPPDGSDVSRWLGYVSVPDVDAAAQEVEEAGGEVVKGPLDVRLGRAAAVIDPQGAVVGLAHSDVGDPVDEGTWVPGASPGWICWRATRTPLPPSTSRSSATNWCR